MHIIDELLNSTACTAEQLRRCSGITGKDIYYALGIVRSIFRSAKVRINKEYSFKINRSDKVHALYSVTPEDKNKILERG